MEWWILLVVVTGIFKISSAARCDLILQKDGSVLQDGEHVLGIGGDLNQIYCKALCSGPGPTPAIRWYRQPGKRPIRRFGGRVYQVRTTFERVGILTIRNMLYKDTTTYMCRGWLRDQGWIEKSFELTYGCKDSYHLCDTSKCISEAYVCDGKSQCSDGTDEQNCRQCNENQFQCSDGDCIKGNMRCDGYSDCIDGSDEYNCGCKPDFECSFGGCVPQYKVCDGTYDCSIGEDEVNCTYCEDGEFHCGKRVCIAAELRCNGWNDCSDGSDESECPLKVKIEKPRQEVSEGETVRFICVATPSNRLNSIKLTWSKSEGELSDLVYLHENTLTIPEADRMDAGIYICTGSDGSSINKAEAELIVNESCIDRFQCLDGTCIEHNAICDGYNNCSKGEDEENCTAVCETYQWMCIDGSCIDNTYVCDLISDCPNGDDEENCTFCAIDEYHCGGGKCIPDYQQCDHIQQCDNGSDEFNCVAVCETYHFMCSDGSCINNTYVCDHISDCPNGDDEENCTCYTDSFRCDTTQCIDKSAVCNGTFECMNRMDEENCENEETPNMGVNTDPEGKIDYVDTNVGTSLDEELHDELINGLN